MKQVVILGSGEHAVVVIDILRAMGGFEIVGCIADDTDPHRLVLGVPIIGRADRVDRLAREGLSAAIGLGGWSDNADRARLYDRAMAAGVDIVTPIHPRAYIAPEASVGRGSVICAGAHIGVGTTVGNNVIVHYAAIIAHLSTIGDHALISGGAMIGAKVTIGTEAVVAIGATVASKLTVGPRALVSAGSAAVRDVPAGTRVRGVPAQPRGRVRP